MTFLNRLREWTWFSESAAGTNHDDVLDTSPAGSRAARLLKMAAEAGAEAGLLARDVDTAIARLEAEVVAMAQEAFTVEDSEPLAAQEEAALAEVLALRTAARSMPAMAPPRESIEPVFACRTRRAIAAASAVVCLGAALQSAGIIGWPGWVLLVAGVTCLITVAPEAGLARRRAAQAFGAWRNSRRARAALLAAEMRLGQVRNLGTRNLATARLQEKWLALTRQRLLTELRLQQDRGAHQEAGLITVH